VLLLLRGRFLIDLEVFRLEILLLFEALVLSVLLGHSCVFWDRFVRATDSLLYQERLGLVA
jgi:hypothetical protein